MKNNISFYKRQYYSVIGYKQKKAGDASQSREKINNVESRKEAKIKEKNMYIKEDGNRKNHKGQGKSDEENWKIRSPEEVLGDDELVKGISLKDIPDGKRVELQLSRRGVKKLYDEGVRVAKHDGFSDTGADAFARQLIEITLQSYVKGYVKSKFGIKTEDFDLIHSQNTTAAVIDEMIKHNTEE